MKNIVIYILLFTSCRTTSIVGYANKSFSNEAKKKFKAQTQILNSRQLSEHRRFENQLRREVFKKMNISKFTPDDTLYIIESHSVIGEPNCGMIKFNQEQLCYCRGKAKSDTIQYFTENIFNEKMTELFIKGQYDKLVPAFSTTFYFGITITKEKKLKYAYHEWQWW